MAEPTTLRLVLTISSALKLDIDHLDTPVGQARAQIIDKLDEACTNGDDRMMLVQHSSGDRVMS